MAEKRKIVYSEPESYFPKAIRDKYFGDEGKKKTSKNTKSAKKTTSKK